MHVVQVSRNVTVAAHPSLREGAVYARLDYANSQMLLALAPGVTLTYIGLEVLNSLDLLGLSHQPLRFSPNATLRWERCVARRRVGWSPEASLLNLLAAPRPADEPGPQLAWLTSARLTYAATTGPGGAPGGGGSWSWPRAVNVVDFRLAVPVDTSLAFQNISMGGYKQVMVDSWYVVENWVSEDCMRRKSGVECLTALALQLEQQDSAAAGGGAAGGGSAPAGSSGGSSSGDSGSSSSNNTAMIITIAVVVPAGVVLLAAAAGVAFVVVRRRRRRAGGSQQHRSPLVPTDSEGEEEDGEEGEDGEDGEGEEQAVEGGGGEGRTSRARSSARPTGGRRGGAGAGGGARSSKPKKAKRGRGGSPGGRRGRNGEGVEGDEGDDEDEEGGGGSSEVFEGLEANTDLPRWSPAAGEVEAEMDLDDDGEQPGSPAAAAAGAAAAGAAGAAAGAAGAAAAPAGGQQAAARPSSPGAAAAAGAAGLGPGPQGHPQGPHKDHHAVPAAAAAAAAHSPASQSPAAADRPSRASNSGRLKPALSAVMADEAAAGGGGGGGHHSDEGEGGEVVRVSPSAEAPSLAPADMAAELTRLAAELRGNVRDTAIRLDAVIGSGSFGTVYRGSWQGLPVAIKTVVFSTSADSRRRALQEAALCQSINHPNIIATYASEVQPLGNPLTDPASASASLPLVASSAAGGPVSGASGKIMDWRLYIIQEYADGGPLRGLYGNRAIWSGQPGEVDLAAAVGLALGIARALAHLHTKRIIHGDLNPNNVLLKRDPAEPCGYGVKVGDFGLSVMLPLNRTHLSNMRMGTMFYMCPAVVLKAQVGPASDVFSLGVMLWELYHGRRAGVRTKEGPRYCSIFPAFPPSCPEAYRVITLHCLQRQPQNRPPAEAVVRHLESLAAALRAAAALRPYASAPNSGFVNLAAQGQAEYAAYQQHTAAQAQAQVQAEQYQQQQHQHQHQQQQQVAVQAAARHHQPTSAAAALGGGGGGAANVQHPHAHPPPHQHQHRQHLPHVQAPAPGAEGPREFYSANRLAAAHGP
ncbi:hypothetical protein HXX76_012573 [Chlamydomonas incerta]|uniref:Protein kinase domain-containing protein n=1 Tax=Chlamydomonas incerta TaxID=51695 RepID=A0A835SH02_CHLIN|nr:hypothetical protein HXX76_012573 [Chlamydomonas incerta]|eukprot:KAG2427057.1 hypothetical protein HXX76_012573 [Chlamydomonas incerta]